MSRFYSVFFDNGINSGEIMIEVKRDEDPYTIAERHLASLGYTIDDTMLLDFEREN